jgi:hypothetical protein
LICIAIASHVRVILIAENADDSRFLRQESAPGGPFGRPNTGSGRYTITFSAFARNIFNRVNLAPPIGNLSSPLFGQSIALAGGPYNTASANRRIDFQFGF